jgi:putative toxin-antitoxin system antitoxin component (TIGR02293 family)
MGQMATPKKENARYLQTLLEILSGDSGSYRSVEDSLELHQRVREGLPFESFESLRSHLDSTQSEMADLLLISLKTIQRRKKEKRLTPEESDRLARVARVLARASVLFGDEEKALLWLRSPLPALGGRLPWDYLDTDIGVERIEDLLGRIAHGVFS